MRFRPEERVRKRKLHRAHVPSAQAVLPRSSETKLSADFGQVDSNRLITSGPIGRNDRDTQPMKHIYGKQGAFHAATSFKVVSMCLARVIRWFRFINAGAGTQTRSEPECATCVSQGLNVTLKRTCELYGRFVENPCSPLFLQFPFCPRTLCS